MPLSSCGYASDTAVCDGLFDRQIPQNIADRGGDLYPRGLFDPAAHAFFAPQLRMFMRTGLVPSVSSLGLLASRAGRSLLVTTLLAGLVVSGCSDEPAATTKKDAGGGSGDTALLDTEETSAGSDTTVAETIGTDAVGSDTADTKPQCTTSAQCDDNNPCTTDVCKSTQTCSNTFNTDPCDDGDPCTQDDACEFGECVGSGSCGSETSGGDSSGGTDNTPGCDNTEWLATQGDTFITFLQQCGQGCISNPSQECIADCITSQTSLSSSCAICWGAATACAGQACLTDCIGSATSVGCKTCIATSCGAALSTCAGQKAAVCGSAADCDDGNTCTTDTCDAQYQCVNTAAPCDDGNPCTTDACKSGQGCVGTPLAGGVTCTDGDACTTGDVCLAGDCTGTAVDCDDGVTCTTDSCASDTGCGHVANDADCADNNSCTTNTCDLSVGCTMTTLADAAGCDDGSACTAGDKCIAGLCIGVAKDCNDDIGCTSDSCSGGNCQNVPSAAACDDDIACTNDSCDTATGCVNAANNLACSDGKDCTTDTCGNAGCTNVGNNVACDDDVACTTDTCGDDGCVNTPDDTACNDDLACTTDSCDVETGCKQVADNNLCNDDNVCTADVCVTGLGCAYNDLPGTVTCTDDNVCTTEDACDGGDCTGAAVDCSDDVSCTVTGCDTAEGCSTDFSAALCNDNNPCTTDFCSSTGCVNELAGGKCHIDGACFVDGATKSDDPCQVCNVDDNATGWSAGNESQACNEGGVCWNGTCTPELPGLDAIHDGKTCGLPECSTTTTIPVDYAGNWKVTTKTLTTTCGVLMQAVDPQLKVGHVKTGNAHPLNFAGSCDFASGGQTVQIGTFVSNTQVTCEAKPEAEGATLVEVSKVTFTPNGTASGTAKAILYDLPIYAFEEGNTCEITLEVTMERVPDCVLDSDCEDGLACTTNSCASGVCKHAINAGTCAIEGQCYNDGDRLTPTGNGSCSVCVGTAPSQGGWVVYQNGEPCDTGLDGPTAGVCGIGGVCSVPQ
jgi:hypothetical protein